MLRSVREAGLWQAEALGTYHFSGKIKLSGGRHTDWPTARSNLTKRGVRVKRRRACGHKSRKCVRLDVLT
jgi:hypothetical protein